MMRAPSDGRLHPRGMDGMNSLKRQRLGARLEGAHRGLPERPTCFPTVWHAGEEPLTHGRDRGSI